MEESSHYMRVEPNSHCFESLNNILIHNDYTPEELTLDYLVTGFKNTLERGWDLEFDKSKIQKVPPFYYFPSIENIMIHLATQKEENQFNIKNFIILIKSTIGNGYDLKETKQIKTKMKKKKVYNRVDGELYYQELKWVVRRDANGTPDESKPPAEWINYMQQHVNDANKGVYNLDDEEALAQIRKVVALGVRCLMIHGCPERIIPEELLDGEKN